MLSGLNKLLICPFEGKNDGILKTLLIGLMPTVSLQAADEIELLWVSDTGFLCTVVVSDVDWDAETIEACGGCGTTGNPPGNKIGSKMGISTGSKAGIITSALRNI